MVHEFQNENCAKPPTFISMINWLLGFNARAANVQLYSGDAQKMDDKNEHEMLMMK